MVRKLAAALLGVGVLIPGLANALGLGAIKLHSALNEPLNADIELVQVRELSSTEIIPGLASNSEFKSADVDRTQFLTGLKFEVHVNEHGKSYIHVSSRKPVKEPFLNFLVEVNWPAGRLLREYTLLLDPPIYSEQRAQEVKTAQAGSAQPAARTSAPASQATNAVAETPAQSTPNTGTGGGVASHTISRNDSLWSIAKKLKPSDNVSVQQTMLALQRINPDAFIDNNINLLRRGQVLRAPTDSEAMKVSARDAIALVAEQNRAWREQVSGRKQASPEARQIDLSGRSAGSTPPAPKAGEEGKLKLLSGTGQSTSGQGGTGSGTGALRDKLSAAQENADKYKLANEDLKVKMNDLQDQLKTSEKVLTLKDQQIAALQAKMAELEKQAKDAQAAAAKANTTVATAAQPAEQAATQPAATAKAPAEQEATATKPAAEDNTTAQQNVDYNYQEGSAAKPQQPESAKPTASAPTAEMPAATEEKPESAAAPKPAPKPAPQPSPVSSPDLMTQIMSNPLYLGVGGGALVLLLLAGLIAMRGKKSAEDEYDEPLVEDFQFPESSAEESSDEFDTAIDDFMEDEVVADEEPLHHEETVPQTSDVLGEADIYIAYGRFPQAIEMLQKAAEKEPDRADIRLKLCEVCADAGDAPTFMTHYEVLKQIGSSSDVAKAEELRERVAPEGAAPAEIDDSGFDEEFAEEATSIAVDEAESFDFDIADSEPVADAELEGESDTGLDFDLGDLEDTNASFAEPAQEEKPEQPQGEALSDEGVMDFDLEFETPQAETPAAESASEDNALDFDTEFSLDSVESVAAETEQPDAGMGEDLSLDFDQMEIESAEGATTEQVAGMDFDLDFDIEEPTPGEAGAESQPEAEDETLMFSPSENETGDETVVALEPGPGEESNLDSASAAQLADELDFDLDSDLAGDEVQAEPAAVDDAAPIADAPFDEDATVLAPQADFAPTSSAPSQAANDMGDEEELDFLSDSDETSTKLDLARAYIDMGDRDGARDILDEVLIEGNDNQKSEAKELLTRLES